jgi:hypothetical protein
MSAGPRLVHSLQDGYQDRVEAFFEPQLAALDLREGQIKRQTSLDKLHRDLDKVNDALTDPSSFGTLRLKMDLGGRMIATTADDAQIEAGILPLLLQRKEMIIERISELGGIQSIKNIRDLISQVDDNGVREELLNQVEELETNAQQYETEASKLQAQREQIEEDIKTQHAATMLSVEAFERRSKVYQSFLERESVASIVGAFLLLALALTIVLAMFVDITPSDVVTNSFLLILGYFFGQTVLRANR